ncbi:MAG: hypothetical protein K2M80_04685, partial [Muribaculaceae bacterium]|nr:hypothetical protein [Muribaculaceae bacterium]
MNATTTSRFQIMICHASVGKGFDAYNKARHDCATTLSRLGYQRADLLFPTGHSPLRNRLGFYRDALRTINHVARNCPKEVIIQYPLNDRFIPKLLMRYLMRRCRSARIILLIHDVDSLRERARLESYEKSFFNRADLLLVHTPSMEAYLTDHGVITPMRHLNLFDYYATEAPLRSSLDNESDSIVFAGNLLKSPFLTSLKPNILSRQLHLYGAVAPDSLPPNATYQGRFHPDHISDIRGRWGLVWDGTVSDCAQSTLGDYLRFNASHKASLYLA